MLSRLVIRTVACGLVLVCAFAVLSARNPALAQGPMLDRLLTAYEGGDFESVAKVFARSQDFHVAQVAQGRRFERWLGRWQRSKAALVLELAETSIRVAPQYTRLLLDAGRRYIMTAQAAGELGPPDQPFTRTWHRAALGLLQRAGNASIAEEYLDGLDGKTASATAPPPMDIRLLLARAIAMEQRCWFERPMLDRADVDVESLMRAARMTVRDPSGPSKSVRTSQSEAHRQCLQNAVERFRAAAEVDETRAEARVRAGWIEFQLGNPREALEWLDLAEADGDRDVAYWAALFRGRVLDALGRQPEAIGAYREALAICPAAQSASVGLSLALFRADRLAEADDIARTYRMNAASVSDPWWSYSTADHRFVARWIAELRTMIR